jgi:MFS family permease
LTNSLFFFLLFLLAGLTAAGVVTVWYLLAYSFLHGVVIAFDTPTRQALLPHLIDDRKDLMNAVALHSTIWQTGRVVGPAIAGILIIAVGMAPIFFIAAATYLAMVLAMTRVRVSVEVRRSGRGMGAALWEGVQYVRRNSVFSSVIGLVFANSLFGMSFIFLMPVFAGDVLNVDSRGYGFLMTSMGVGTLAGGFLTAAMGRFRRKQLLLLGASGLYGLLLVLFSFSHLYASSVVLIFLAGFMQQIYMVTAQTVIQWLVPDEVRGRVMAIYAMVWSLTPLGALQAGTIANYLGAPIAVAIGGAVVTGFTLFLVAAVPRMRKLEL